MRWSTAGYTTRVLRLEGMAASFKYPSSVSSDSAFRSNSSANAVSLSRRTQITTCVRPPESNSRRKKKYYVI